MWTLGTGVLAALTGCSVSDPAIRGHTPAPVPSAPTTPGPLPYLREGLATQQTLTKTVLGVRARASALQLTPAQVGLVTWLGQATARQTAALRLGTPTAPRTSTPVEPPPTPSPRLTADWPALLSELRTAGAAHLARARATTGLTAAMWAALAAHVLSVAAAPTGAQARSQVWHPALIDVGDEISALRAAIAGTHALCFAAELSLVPLTTASPDYRQLSATWQKWRRTRDELSRLVRDLGAEPPGSKAPYDVPPPRDAASARALMAGLETRLLPSAGAWVAAADGTKLRALNLLVGTAVSAAQLGGELQVWPGWPRP